MPLEQASKPFTYINFMRGKFTLRVPEDDPHEDKIKRLNKNNINVYERHFDKLSDVFLADVREAEHDEYGPSYEFIFQDQNEYLFLRLSKKSRIATMILNKLENITLDKVFTIRGYYFTDDDKSAIGIYQDGVKLQNVYTKDNPGALPPPKKIKVSGVDTWDWTEQLVYWSELIKSLKPHMLGVNEVAAQVAQAQAEAPPQEPVAAEAPKQSGLANDGPTAEDETDDLPF